MSRMRILKHQEVFKRMENRVQFDRIKFTIEQNGAYYVGYSKNRRKNPDKLSQLEDTQEIRTKDRGPRLQHHWTVALPTSDTYVKKPALDDYLKPGLEALIEREIEVCEAIKQRPHPALAMYYGCVEVEGRVSGLSFARYKETLTERVNPGRLSKRDFIASGRPLVENNMRRWLESVESALRHLHSLGFVHNDITPANIMLNEDDRAVIIDFDSTCRIGESLEDKKRTYGWTDRDVTHATPTNDLKALGELETWLFGSADDLTF